MYFFRLHIVYVVLVGIQHPGQERGSENSLLINLHKIKTNCEKLSKMILNYMQIHLANLLVTKYFGGKHF